MPQDGFNDRLKQLAQQNQLPVLVQGGDIDWQKDIAFPEGLAYDISGWLDENPDIKDILIPEGVEYCTTEDGAIYSMPLATVRPTGFYWNTQLWDPTEDLSQISMDEFLSLIGDQKIAFSTAENGWVCALFLTALIAAQGGGDEVVGAMGRIPLPNPELADYVGKDVVVGIRPEDFHEEQEYLDAAPSAVIDAQVDLSELMGSEVYVYFTVGERRHIARISSRLDIHAGDTVRIAPELDHVHVFDKETEKAICHGAAK